MSGRARPLVSRRALGAWLVLLGTLPMGLRSYYLTDQIGFFTWNPGGRMGVNFRTYHYAVERAREGLLVYDAPPPDTYDWAVYLYPPGTLPSFYPFAPLDWQTGYAILIILSILAAGIATWLVVRYVESLGPALGWIDVVLVFAAFLFSTHTFGTIFFGNINLLLALGIVGGFWALTRERDSVAGVAFGVVALYKIFPALIGLWLLRTRQWRAVAAAIATGVGGLVLGLVLYGIDATRYYLTEVMIGRTESELFVGGYPIDETYYVTIQQPISRLVAAIWPSAPYLVIFGVSVLVCLGILAYFYRDLSTDLDRQMAIFATLVVMIIILPSLRWYLILLYLPLVSILYLWQDGRARYVFIAGGVLMSITTSTEGVVMVLGDAPNIVETLAYPIGSSGVIPLYGLLVMVLACAWEKYRRRPKSDSGESAVERAESPAFAHRNSSLEPAQE